MSVYQLSRGLAYLLRHGIIKNKLPISSDGYVPLDEILKLNQFKDYNVDDFLEATKNNNKKRFSVKEIEGKFYIRANQGHSREVGDKINQEELLIKLDKPLPIIVHGTTYLKWEIIKKTGLKKMARTHIHFAINDDFIKGNQEQSGIRYNCEVLIYINMDKAMKDGIDFYISENSVILSQGVGEEGVIEPKYFHRVVDKKTKKILF